jgi:hypothetical protein
MNNKYSKDSTFTFFISDKIPIKLIGTLFMLTLACKPEQAGARCKPKAKRSQAKPIKPKIRRVHR